METAWSKSEITDTPDVPEPKVAKLEKEQRGECEDLDLTSLAGFVDVKMLRQDVQKKVAFMQAKMSGRAGHAVVILEKTAFTEDGVKQLLSSSTELKFRMRNDVYRQYDGYPQPHANSVQTTVIYPATDEFLAKLGSDEVNLVEESPQLYELVTKKFIEQEAHSLQVGSGSWEVILL